MIKKFVLITVVLGVLSGCHDNSRKSGVTGHDLRLAVSECLGMMKYKSMPDKELFEYRLKCTQAVYGGKSNEP